MLKSFSVQQVLGAAGPANSVLFLNASGVPTGTSGLNYAFSSGMLGIGSTPNGRVHARLDANDTYVFIAENRGTGGSARAGMLFSIDSGNAGYVGANGSQSGPGIGFANSTLLQSFLGAGVTVLASNTNGGIDLFTGGSASANRRVRIPPAGGMVVGNGSTALATNATGGFIYVPTCAGTPTGTPTAQTGTAPIVIDTTNNKLYFYSGGSWRDAGP